MAGKNNKKLRLSEFPSISSVLESSRLKPLVERWSFPFVSAEVKAVAAEMKKQAVRKNIMPGLDDIVSGVLALFRQYENDLIKPVINGTGVILHTNLGRAPIGREYYDRMKDIACGYSNLEFDIGANKRSKRGVMVGRMLAAYCGAEAGMIVNNNASCVYMIVANLAQGKEVVISRGQLVQIGGGFRIPDIIERSGANLKEIGTTNKTSISDYNKAITKNTGLILIVHKSNFIQRGFTEEPEPSRIVELGKKKKTPVCFDLGSGLPSLDNMQLPESEPDIIGAVRTGADLVCFSGDKLLGGPQAGLIVGKRKYVSSLLKDPLYRVVRPDKLTIGLMEKTILGYMTGKDENPCWELANLSSDSLKKRAEMIVQQVNDNNVITATLKSSFGGGSLPEYEYDSYGIKIEGKPTSISSKLRSFSPPVVARSVSSGVLIDLRTVFPDQDRILINAIKSCL
ncbi:MAG: L-seryl-tRNA(Sec) selenium transferase [Candidatus Zixiibacteriota bacterium]|nr:MAG: L-seryl-tRNA(Sec) selenium transferase [candidate division Zixibacteria bacterium]